MTLAEREYTVHLRSSVQHPIQDAFVHDGHKRIDIKAGRRAGKTIGIAKRAVLRFLKGRRQLYGAPTIEQVDAFWFEVCRSLAEPIAAGIYKKNEAEHSIELAGTKQRIRAKTAWNAETWRGDYGDDVYLDEYQLMDETAWPTVIAPMLLDNNGDAVFVFTPPSLASVGVSKARDPRHASKMFNEAKADTTGRWATYHFTSHDNPFISHEALAEITKDMTMDAYRREIMAQDDEIQDSWLVYPFNSVVCKIARFPIPKTWLVYSGHDFGSANPAALFVAQDPATGFFYAFREYLPGARATDRQVEDWKLLTDGYTVIKRVGGSHQEDSSRQNYTAHGWPITEPKISGSNAVKAQVDRVRDLMTLNKLYVFSDLTYYLTELANCLWKLDEQNKPINEVKDEAKYHLSACARYLLSEFTPETVARGPGYPSSPPRGGYPSSTRR